MKSIFEPRGFFTVRDGTEVSPFINATDVKQTDVPWGLLQDVSISAGRIRAGVRSWIHVHPVVVQVTYVTGGRLSVWMKDAERPEPYVQDLRTGQAVVTEPGTLFQLENVSDSPAEVLYIVSPSYVFETAGDKVIYDEAILVARSWEELEAAGYDVPALKIQPADMRARRAEALNRLAVAVEAR